MQNKNLGIIFIVGAVSYILFTAIVLGHGLHPLNMIAAVILFIIGFYLFFPGNAPLPSEEQVYVRDEVPAEEHMAVSRKIKIFFISLAFALLAAIIIALTYLATTPADTLTTILSFVGGVSNIVLPCTLPLVFIIVPLSMGKGYKKGLIMAVLFGVGLTIMLAIYGAAIALVGKYLGLDQATKILYLVAGIAALIFGLSTLTLFHFEMPSYSKVPKFIQGQGDYLKAFFLGLFLGNAGIGCPNPITYLILIAAAGTGSMAVGSWYMAVNGLGRALPLLFFAVLGIIGVNAASGLIKRKIVVDKITGWTLVVISMFIILNGIFGHLWYEGSIFHDGLNIIFEKVGGGSIAEADIPIEKFEKAVPFFWIGSWINLIFPSLILAWYYLKKKPDMSRKTFIILLGIFILWGLITFPVGFKMN